MKKKDKHHYFLLWNNKIYMGWRRYDPDTGREWSFDFDQDGWSTQMPEYNDMVRIDRDPTKVNNEYRGGATKV